jgi:hypothetical protein
MITDIVSNEDLERFRLSLLEDIKKIFFQKQAPAAKKWLKSHEVRRILAISPGTLQNLRINGSLPFTKIGGIIFYDQKDIDIMLEDRKQNFSFEERLKQINAKKVLA